MHNENYTSRLAKMTYNLERKEYMIIYQQKNRIESYDHHTLV